MTIPALITLKRMPPLSAEAVASPLPSTVKAVSAARMADDNRIRPPPGERCTNWTRSQPRGTKMQRIEQPNKFKFGSARRKQTSGGRNFALNLLRQATDKRSIDYLIGERKQRRGEATDQARGQS